MFGKRRIDCIDLSRINKEFYFFYKPKRGPPPAHVWEENKTLKMQLASERQDHERLQEEWQARLQSLEQQLAAFNNACDDEKRDRERALENEKRERERALENEKRDREQQVILLFY